MPMGARALLIAGNWKMNGTRSSAARFIDDIANYRPPANPGRQLLICPPATLIGAMAEPLMKQGILIGGQDCHAHSHGAFTGDISAAMLADSGCSHVIVGHSERRTLHAETSQAVCAKVKAALSHNLVPIVCVGETLEQRETGNATAIVVAQINESIPDGVDSAAFVVAYEPIWAIGSGRTATADDIDFMHAAIKKTLAGKTASGSEGRVLYGGSVKPSNASEILGLDRVDGALIGGASLDARDFLDIAALATI
jgi:triosephosphate isomerase